MQKSFHSLCFCGLGTFEANLFVKTNISPPHLTTQLTLAANREARNVSRRGRQP